MRAINKNLMKTSRAMLRRTNPKGTTPARHQRNNPGPPHGLYGCTGPDGRFVWMDWAGWAVSGHIYPTCIVVV